MFFFHYIIFYVYIVLKL